MPSSSSEKITMIRLRANLMARALVERLLITTSRKPSLMPKRRQTSSRACFTWGNWLAETVAPRAWIFRALYSETIHLSSQPNRATSSRMPKLAHVAITMN